MDDSGSMSGKFTHKVRKNIPDIWSTETCFSTVQASLQTPYIDGMLFAKRLKASKFLILFFYHYGGGFHLCGCRV
jgi:hypothetical protein